MAKRARITTIGGKSWRIEYAHIADYGHCEYGSCRRTRRIRINPNQSDEALLDTLIHEVLHAQDWDLDENAVARRATEMRTAICKMFRVSRIGRGLSNQSAQADE